jgi:putative ABC transport system permease protein
VSPVIQGGMAALEAIVPAGAGAAVGWLAALGLVRLFGPSPFIQPSVERSSMASTAWVVAFGVLFLGAAATLATRLQFEEVAGRLPGRISRAPWEAVVLLLAAAAFYEIHTRVAAVSSEGAAPKLDRLLLLFPLLFIAGFAGLAVRGLRVLLVRVRQAGSRWRPAAYLALRRLASAPRMALLLVTASSLAVGILVYAVMVSDSVTSTTRQKALVATGSDVAVPLSRSATLPARLPGGSTVVARVDQASVVPAGQAVQVLVVDPSTFARAAFWDPNFSRTSLPDMLRRLGGNGVRLPVVAVGIDLGANAALRLVGANVPVATAASAVAFPGIRGGRPMVVVSAAALARATPNAQAITGGARQIWAKGDPATVLRAIRRAGLSTAGATTAARLERTPAFLAVSWTFSFLEALGLVAGLVVLVGLVLYLQSRQESREVSYALAKRMGLSSGSHRRSVGLELGGMLLGAFVIGTALAAAATRLIYRKLDLLPGQPPAPLYRIPGPILGAIALALAVVAALGALAVQRRANRANVAEVIRLAA